MNKPGSQLWPAAICSLLLGLSLASLVAASDSGDGSHDTDGDGLPDTFELDNGLDPDSAADAALDNDDDGLSNLLEFLQGLDPNDASSNGNGITSTNLQDPEFRLSSLRANFADVDYIGAFAQDEPENWTLDWTVGVNGNTTVWAPAEAGTLGGAEPVADGNCPSGTTPEGSTLLPDSHSGRMDLCRLPQRFAGDGTTLTLTNDNIYLLGDGFPGTYIGNGEANDGNSANDVEVALVIEPGTLILATEEEALIITRGSDVFVRGTREDPVVMSSLDWFDDWLAGGDGTSDRGEWAGFVIMGYARSNECGTPCDVAAEGNIGAYGGSDDQDGSGDVRYLVIRHAGNDIDGNGNELNGYTLFATGSGTRSSYVQVHKGLDDGVEHFGSTDHMDHLVLTANRDDSFDWGQGYRGTAQFVLILQAADDADRGIEADNDFANPELAPVSRPILANFTILGQPAGDSSADGILLRRGTGGLLHNFLVAGFADACIDVDGADTVQRFGTDLIISNSLADCGGAGENFESGDGDIERRVVQNWWEGGRLNMLLPANLMESGQPAPAVNQGNRPSPDISLFAVLLPTSRSVPVNGMVATVWATVTNAGTRTARNCVVGRRTNVGADFWFHTIAPESNQFTGTRNAMVDLASGQVQTYLLALDPVIDFGATEVEFSFECANAAPARVIPGLNTLLLSAPKIAGPDVIALSATLGSEADTVDVSLANGGVFAVATANVGVAGRVTTRLDFGGLPLLAAVCQIDAAAKCVDTPGATVELEVGERETASFAVFLRASAQIAFDPADHRIRVFFLVGEEPVGSTSVAVQTLP